jgi:excisionase family DNA binding protein
MRHNLLYLTEVAAEARVSLFTVRHWVSMGKLPTGRPGRRRLVQREDFDAFLATDIGSPPKAPGKPGGSAP